MMASFAYHCRSAPTGGANQPTLRDLCQTDAAWAGDTGHMLAFGRTATYQPPATQGFAAAQRWWTNFVASCHVNATVCGPGTGPVVFASFRFAPDHTNDTSGVLVVPKRLHGRSGLQHWATTIDTALADTCDLTTPHVEETWDTSGHRQQPRPLKGPQVRFEPGAFTDDEWKKIVAEAVATMADGPLEKVVLARDRFAYTDSPWNMGQVLTHLAEHHRQCWTFLVDGLVGATPELLLRKRQGEVSSKVLAGTIPRTHDAARDRTSAEHLLQSPRMREEHHHAVASLTAALQGLPLSVSDPYVLELPSVLHLATDITAPAPDVHIFTLLERIHPTAAVAGTPKPLALETITALEGSDRGRYAGPVGWVDAHGDGEFGLALRCAQIDPTTPQVARMFAGCGIMPASDPSEELCESDAKFAPMTTALWNTARLH